MTIAVSRFARLYLSSPDLLDSCTREGLSKSIHLFQGCTGPDAARMVLPPREENTRSGWLSVSLDTGLCASSRRF